jgi:adenylate kinase
LGIEYLNIGDLVEKEDLIIEADEKRDTVVADMKRLSNRIGVILKEANGDIILEGHYVYDLVPKIVQPFVFVLRRHPVDLSTVLKKRGYDENKVSENVAAEALDVCLVGALKRFGHGRVDEIDTTHMSIEVTVKEILAVLRGEKEARVGIVDWLGRLEEEGQFEELLRSKG